LAQTVHGRVEGPLEVYMQTRPQLPCQFSARHQNSVTLEQVAQNLKGLPLQLDAYAGPAQLPLVEIDFELTKAECCV
jgi:hypothetical protein